MIICLDCRYSRSIETSDGKYHCICIKVESPNFMTPVDYIFGSCDQGEEFEVDEP